MEPEQNVTAWMPANVALRALSPHNGGSYATKLLIADLLKDGQLEAITGFTWVSNHSSLSQGWKHRDEASPDCDIVLSRQDWAWSRFWGDDLDNWRWAENRFVLTRRKNPGERRFLVDVAFRTDQVHALLPSSRKGIGGKPIRVENWASIAIALIDLAHEGWFRVDPSHDGTPRRFKDASDLVDRISSATNETYASTHSMKLMRPIFDHYYSQTQSSSLRPDELDDF